MLYLYWRKAGLSLLILLISLSWGFAQHGMGNLNYFAFSKKPYYFGLRIGTNYADYKINRSKDFIGNQDYKGIKSITGRGASASVIFNLKIGQFFDVRLLPSVAFINRNIEFTRAINQTEDVFDRVESIYLEMPILLRYKSLPYKDKKAFIVGGIKYAYDVQSNAKFQGDRFNDLLKTSPHDFAFEIGAGVQFFFQYFIFSPEIKFSQGIDNVLIFSRDNNRVKIIERIFTRSLSLAIHLEG